MIWLMGLLLFLAILGAPLFVVIAAGSLLGFNHAEIDLSVLGIEMYRLAEMPVLAAIPLFTFAGYLLGESNAPKRLVAITQTLMGWLPGGLAFIALIACAFFTAFTGASGVTIVALGALLYPAMLQADYSERFSLGLVTTSGSLGLLFAPSLPLILYAVVVQQMELSQPVSVDALFKAGAVPGVLMLVLLGGWSFWVNRNTAKEAPPFKIKAALRALKDGMWELPLPVVVLGGIYSGTFAVSEAAAVTAIYVVIVEVFILREVPLPQLPRVMRESMTMVGGIMIILGVSLASTNYLIYAEAPEALFEWVGAHVHDRFTFLLLLNVFLLALGAFLDIFSAIVLVVPLILPVAMGYDIHPVHLGIIFLANMQLGYLTPPVGLNLFISSYRFDRPITEVYRACLPFIALLLLSVLLITYWPALSLWAL